jgi:hypothetical protein
MADNKSGVKAKRRKTVDVTISLVNKVLQYTSDGADARRTKLNPGDTLAFHCPGPSAIEFKGTTPFRHLPEQSDGNNKIVCRIGGHANVGTYYYTIASYIGGKVYMDDPEIVIPDNTVLPVRTENKPTGPVKPAKPATR